MDASINNEKTIKKEFIMKENVVNLFKKYNVPHHINLLSIDIDFNDFYCLHEIIKNYRSDIIICEYNATHLVGDCKIIIYDKNGKWDGSNYFGASLLSFNKLLTMYNYSLVYCENMGVNAFFIHNDNLKDHRFKNVGDINKLYKPAKYGNGPNGGHIQDKYNRRFLSFDEVAFYSDNLNTRPNIIYFCNKTIGEHDIASANKWKELNPEYELKLYDDEMIRTFLLHEYGALFKDIFDYIPDGPIKSDFWRVCILYKYGGVYSDIDNVPLVKISEFIDPSCDLVTCSSYISFLFNPNFIVSHKGNIVLKRCIEWYILKYANINKDEYKYWDWSVMNAFTQNLHLDNYNKEAGIYNAEHMKVQIIKEFPGKNYEDAHNIYNNIRIFNNRQPNWDYVLHKFK
jgi:mannosyltransferase OCH1-like enzyme